MKITVPDYYKDFKCIASECTDSCCAGWEVELDQQSYDYYKSVEGPFGDRLRSVMTVNDGEINFILQNNRCPFLNDRNLCDLYTELGEEKLCDTCTNYPRFIEEYGSTREIGIAVSCIVAAHLVIDNKNQVKFETTENDERVTSCNNIDAGMYMALKSARKLAISILQNRNMSINRRIIAVLLMADELQKKIKKPAKMETIISRFSNQEYVETVVNKAMSCKSKISRLELTAMYFEDFKGMDIVNKERRQKLHDIMSDLSDTEDFIKYYNDREYEYENLLVYYIYRYFLQAVFDNDLLAKVKLMAVSYQIELTMAATLWEKGNRQFTTDEQIELLHDYSRELEHSEENIERFTRLFNKEKRYRLKNIISLFYR